MIAARARSKSRAGVEHRGGQGVVAAYRVERDHQAQRGGRGQRRSPGRQLQPGRGGQQQGGEGGGVRGGPEFTGGRGSDRTVRYFPLWDYGGLAASRFGHVSFYAPSLSVAVFAAPLASVREPARPEGILLSLRGPKSRIGGGRSIDIRWKGFTHVILHTAFHWKPYFPPVWGTEARESVQFASIKWASIISLFRR